MNGMDIETLFLKLGGKMPTAFFVPNLESTVWCACHRLMPMENDKPLLRLSKCHRRLMTLKKLISKKMNLRPRTQSQVGQEDKTSTSEKTAVRVTHVPTRISVHVSSERSQQQNRDKALALLAGKVYAFQEEQHKRELKGLSVEKTVKIEWGSQIRSYVLHPYQLVKDHRTDTEVRDINRVFAGDIQIFLDAEGQLE
jgi:protein subunit release factor A